MQTAMAPVMEKEPAMRRRTRPKIYDELNVTPLMDLAWTLLVVFIIMATATVQGINVDLPKASAAPSLAKPKTKAVTITADGRIYLGTAQVTLAELESQLRQYKAADPELPVVVKGDAAIRYERVIQVLDVIKQLEISNLGLVTQQLVK
jgi:biopolymer transport protein ExbD